MKDTGPSDSSESLPERLRSGIKAAVRRRSGLEVPVHPGRDLFEPSDPVRGLAASGELMVLALEQADPGLNAVDLQSGVKLKRFRERTAVSTL